MFGNVMVGFGAIAMSQAIVFHKRGQSLCHEIHQALPPFVGFATLKFPKHGTKMHNGRWFLVVLSKGGEFFPNFKTRTCNKVQVMC